MVGYRAQFYRRDEHACGSQTCSESRKLEYAKSDGQWGRSGLFPERGSADLLLPLRHCMLQWWWLQTSYSKHTMLLLENVEKL